MSLPPGFLDELRSRVSIAQVVGRKVMWDNRKSNQAKGDMWAPCPFHQEKTASFHVDDRKGYYYCFGCHAKGDAIGFVRETENVSFMEAIEILAREAGMSVPARDPQAQEKADRRTVLTDAMEEAVKFYRLQLKTSRASEAREYLERRGLDAETCDRWEIGFAPPGWDALREHMAGKGTDIQMLLDTGLVRPSSQGKQPYDTFRNRIMFPIRDARGRAIAFGGRAMDPDDNAKYLNSPETELFDKGRSLFNLGPARSDAGKGAPLIVAEGYMDVIALSEAGFPGTVAPLGTAITEEQLRLLWRMHDEPILALDGDRAGLQAAMRAMDLALPMLEAGKSLRFCLMPEGQDPDDLIRSGGSAAMQKALDGAVPMVSLLWRREVDGKVFDSPERRAALDKSLREAIRRIGDPSIRSHYGAEVNRLRQDLFRTRTGQQGGTRYAGNWKARAAATPTSETRSSPLAASPDTITEELREAVILATLVAHPSVVGEVEAELERLNPRDPDRAAILSVLLAGTGRDRAAISEIVGSQALEKLYALRHVQISPGVRNTEDSSLALACVREELAKLMAQRGAEREIAEASLDIDGLADEGVTWRLGQAAEARNRALKAARADDTEYRTAPNGLKIAVDEKSALDHALSMADPTKGGRKGRSN